MFLIGVKEHWNWDYPNAWKKLEVYDLIILCLISNTSFPCSSFGNLQSQWGRRPNTHTKSPKQKKKKVYELKSSFLCKSEPRNQIWDIPWRMGVQFVAGFTHVWSFSAHKNHFNKTSPHTNTLERKHLLAILRSYDFILKPEKIQNIFFKLRWKNETAHKDRRCTLERQVGICSELYRICETLFLVQKIKLCSTHSSHH